MLKSFDECADQLEASERSMHGLTAQANALRRGDINILALSAIRRDAGRIVEALKSIDRLIAVEQGRVPR